MRRNAFASVGLLGLVLMLACNGPGRLPYFTMPGTLPLPLSPLVLAGRDIQGNPIHLEAFRGRVVLIDVWKSG